MQVEEFLEQSARLTPDKTALVCQNNRYAYAEIDRLSNRMANTLNEEGVRRGDRVAVFLDNSVETVVSIFGILKLGAIFLLINPSTKTEKLVYILNDCLPIGLISQNKQRHTLLSVASRISSLRFVILTGHDGADVSVGHVKLLGWSKVFHQQSDLCPPKTAIDMDLATIIYTSGSTGFPKGVMMTHLNIVTAATSITQYLENCSEDILFCALPLSFDYGLYQILMGFKVGGTVVLEKSFAYPQDIIKQLIKEKVTGFPIIPMMAAILLQMENVTPGLFPDLRYITNTADTLQPVHTEKLRKLFPSTKIYSMYGLTECKRVSYLHPEQLDIRPTSVGKAMPNTEAYIVNEGGELVGPGIIGELVVRGSHVMKGYWEKPEETDCVLKPGPLPGEKVLYTGDLFRMDVDGYLYFMGRKDETIKSCGIKVSPKEIEDVLYKLEGVSEAAVVGVSDEVLGQAVTALITLKPGAYLAPQEVLRHCEQHLETHMVPKFVQFRRVLPKTHSGKINKRELTLIAEEQI